MKPTINLPRREVLKAGAAGLLGIIVAAGTRNVAGAQTPSAENVVSNLKALRFGDGNPNYAAQWTYRLAQALGYLSEVGITEFTVTTTDNYIPGMVGGSLDLVHGDTNVFVSSSVASGLPMKMISIYRDSEWWILGVRKGIEVAEDLKGKTLTAGQFGGRNAWIQKQILMKLGLNPETDIQFVPSSGGSDTWLAALLAGTVDGSTLFPRHKQPLEEAGGKFIFAERMPAPQEAFGAMGTWLDQNRDAAYAFTLADLKARQWLFKPENKEKAYQIMIDFGYEIPDRFKANYAIELEQMSPDGGFEASDMDAFVTSLQATGGMPPNVNWREFFDLQFLWAAQDALGLPRRPGSL